MKRLRLLKNELKPIDHRQVGSGKMELTFAVSKGIPFSIEPNIWRTTEKIKRYELWKIPTEPQYIQKCIHGKSYAMPPWYSVRIYFFNCQVSPSITNETPYRFWKYTKSFELNPTDLEVCPHFPLCHIYSVFETFFSLFHNTYNRVLSLTTIKMICCQLIKSKAVKKEKNCSTLLWKR